MNREPALVGQVVRNVAESAAGSVVLQAGTIDGGVHYHQSRLVPVVPHQLPAEPRTFTGRATELSEVDEALTARGGMPICAVVGTGGAGKTWLALRWAHRHLDRFPDGQVFVDLEGFSANSPVRPEDAARGFLGALGVEPASIPADPRSWPALLRSVVADRRILFVLDNAADSTQVAPLLPGSPTCAVLITSRNRLTGLIAAHGTRHVALDVLSAAEAEALLAARIGADRVHADAGALAVIRRVCGDHPLALSVAAAWAETHPRTPLAVLADDLRTSGFAALAGPDTSADPGIVLSWSYRALDPGQARLFRLLGLCPTTHIGADAAAALGGLPLGEARRLLRGLVDRSMLAEDDDGRYRMHDLVHEYAATLTHRAPVRAHAPAIRRLVDFYVHTSFAANRLLDPSRAPIPLDPPAPHCVPASFPDARAAAAWFATEYRELRAVQDLAGRHGLHSAVGRLAWTMSTFQHRQGLLTDQLACWECALDSARRLGDRRAQTRAHTVLGYLWALARNHTEAQTHLHAALELADDPHSRAHVHRNLARAWELHGDIHQAHHHATRAHAAYRALDEPAWEAETLTMLARHTARLGHHAHALAHCQAALTLNRRHGNVTGEADTLHTLGTIAHHTHDHQSAVDHYEQALTLRRALGSTNAQAETLDELGHPLLALGRPQEAAEAWRTAADLYHRLGRTTDAERTLHNSNRILGSGL
ncbi:MAG: tetratricopeptide repeat protein [Saccharothrix sp.]|nr:tetratricopeptide repeat protein [Saccharothrix sp.]